MSVFLPPPTYAQVLLTDPSSGEVKFNPIWLDWFLQLSALLPNITATGTLAQQNADQVTLSGWTRYKEIALPPSPPTGYRQFSGSLVFGATTAAHQVPDGTPNYEMLDVIGNVNAYVGRRANGTSAIRTAALANESLVSFTGFGYGTTGYAALSQGAIAILTAENFTDVAMGTYINFSTTLIGTAVSTEAMRIWDTGAVGLGGPIGAESLRVYKVVGGTRWIKATGSAAGNPTLDVSGGKLGIAATLVLSKATLVETSVALTDGAGAAAGTLLNAPVAGDPTKWFPINDNGTVRYVPSW